MGEPPDQPYQDLRGRDEGETNGGLWNRQPPISREPANRGYQRRSAGNEEPTKVTADEEDKPEGPRGAVGRDTGDIPRWITKRRRSAAAASSTGDPVSGKGSHLPPLAGNGGTGELELPRSPHFKGRFPLEAEITAEPTDQWLLNDYPPTVTLNGTLIVSTGATLTMAPRSEASSNDYSGNALRIDVGGGEGQGGAPREEGEDGEAWGLPALDLWLAGEDEPVFPPP